MVMPLMLPPILPGMQLFMLMPLGMGFGARASRRPLRRAHVVGALD